MWSYRKEIKVSKGLRVNISGLGLGLGVIDGITVS